MRQRALVFIVEHNQAVEAARLFWSRAGFLTAYPSSRYAEMMKTKIDKAKVFVTDRFKSESSVLREAIEAVGLAIETPGNLSTRSQLTEWPPR